MRHTPTARNLLAYKASITAVLTMADKAYFDSLPTNTIRDLCNLVRTHRLSLDQAVSRIRTMHNNALRDAMLTNSLRPNPIPTNKKGSRP